VLESDQDKPAAEQPAFFFRTLSAREFRQLMRAREEPGVSHLDGAIMFLQAAMVDWENVRRGKKLLPFDAKEIDAILDPGEVAELFSLYAATIEKKSASE
jgi:hypothetical protein